MKKVLLLLSIIAGVVIVACNKGTVLPVQSTKTIFSVTGKMTHSKDTIKAAGDTEIFSLQGKIADTSRKYGIAANMEAVDTTNQANVVAAEFVKSITVKFDTSGLGASGLYHWTSSITMIFPPIATKSKVQASGNFTYGLTLSTETGTQNSPDSKTIYVK